MLYIGFGPIFFQIRGEHKKTVKPQRWLPESKMHLTIFVLLFLRQILQKWVIPFQRIYRLKAFSLKFQLVQSCFGKQTTTDILFFKVDIGRLDFSEKLNHRLECASDTHKFVNSLELQQEFDCDGRKILMLIDNCPAHPKVANLKAVTIKFLPPNTTSCLHPMDQGIVQNLKILYGR